MDATFISGRWCEEFPEYCFARYTPKEQEDENCLSSNISKEKAEEYEKSLSKKAFRMVEEQE